MNLNSFFLFLFLFGFLVVSSTRPYVRIMDQYYIITSLPVWKMSVTRSSLDRLISGLRRPFVLFPMLLNLSV